MEFKKSVVCGVVFLKLLALAAGLCSSSWGQTSRIANKDRGTYICTGSFARILYRTDAFQTPEPYGRIAPAWQDYLKQTTKQLPFCECHAVAIGPDGTYGQEYARLENSAHTSRVRLVRIDWKYTPDQNRAAAAPTPARVQQQTNPAQRATTPANNTAARLATQDRTMPSGPSQVRYWCYAFSHQKRYYYYTDPFQPSNPNEIQKSWDKYIFERIDAAYSSRGSMISMCAEHSPDVERSFLASFTAPRFSINHVAWKDASDQNATAAMPITPQVQQQATRPQAGSTSGNGPDASPATQNRGTTSGTLVKMYMYCYTEPSGGVNTYFSDVFGVELPSYVNFHGAAPDPAAVDRIREAFYSGLTQKGYTFKPGHSNCEFRTDEQSTTALKHRRAYEGNPCSNGGKVVETGWRHVSAPKSR